MREMTRLEYIHHQCDKCVDYVECPFLEAFLKWWRKHKALQEFMPDGCDLAKTCQRFRKQITKIEHQKAINSIFGHPSRLYIAKSLNESPKGFTQLKKLLNVTSPTLDYHLKSLIDGQAIVKMNKHKYMITVLGIMILDGFSKLKEKTESK